eukprot:3126374-Pyramimonas_sp.AAC.1
MVPDHQDAAVSLIRGVEIPRTMFWHASRSSTVAFQRGSSLNGNERLWGPMKRELGRSVHSNCPSATLPRSWSPEDSSISCYAMLCYAMLCYAAICYAML